MKILSKITIGVISVFSLCSCKRTIVTKEEFVQAVKELKTDDSFADAKLSFREVKTTGIGSSEIKVTNHIEGEFKKNSSGEWIAASDKNDMSADLLFIYTNKSINPQSYIYSIIDPSASETDSVVEAYYIKPLAYKVVYDIDYTANGDQNLNQENYYEWNDYGYLTCMRGTTIIKDNASGKNVERTKFELKITYR